MRYLRRGRSKVYWLTTCADTSAPTVAELAAGTDITTEIAALEGFEAVISIEPRPTLSSSFTTTLATRTTTSGPTALVFFDTLDGLTTERALLPAGTAGFVVLAPYGAPVATDRVEVWPVTSAGFVEGWSDLAAPTPARCFLAVTSAPDTAATVAA